MSNEKLSNEAHNPPLSKGVVMPRLFTYVYTHNYYHEGGRKIHITKFEDELESLSLCGIFKPYNITYEIDLGWLMQPDPSGDVCAKCKAIAMRFLNEA
jgi:hypothetical protein